MSDWSCTACTFINGGARTKCEMCDSNKPAAAPTAMDTQTDTHLSNNNNNHTINNAGYIPDGSVHLSRPKSGLSDDWYSNNGSTVDSNSINHIHKHSNHTEHKGARGERHHSSRSADDNDDNDNDSGTNMAFSFTDTGDADNNAFADDDDGWGDGGNDGWGDDNGDWGDASQMPIFSDPKSIDVISTKPYRIIDFKKLQLRREEFITDQGELLGLDFEEADLLMRFLRYKPSQIEKFMLDSKFNRDTRINAGISGERHACPSANSEGLIPCSLFCDDVKPNEGYANTSCGHFICNDCWKGYLAVEVDKGVNSVFTRCPGLGKDSSKCAQVLPYSVMQRFLLPHRLRKLDQWIMGDYIRSEKNVKWCPGANCKFAAEYTLGGQCDVFCPQDHDWCFKCVDKAHTPAPCDLLEKWKNLANDEESASQRLIEQMTKKCPKCATRIEKNRACNHVKCTKCNHDFCWQCLGPLARTGGDHPSWYVCNSLDKMKEGKKADELKKREKNTKVLQKLELYKINVSKTEKDMKECPGLIQKINTKEASFTDGRSLKWLVECSNDLKEGLRYLKYSLIFEYFMEDSGRKETFLQFRKKVEERARKLLSKLRGDINNTSQFEVFIGNKGEIEVFKKSVEEMNKKIEAMQKVADLVQETLKNEADTGSAEWCCLRCEKSNPDMKGDKKNLVCRCGACRTHGEHQCLVKVCKQAGSK